MLLNGLFIHAFALHSCCLHLLSPPRHNYWGDHLRQSGPSMAAILGPGGPSMARKIAADGPGGLSWPFRSGLKLSGRTISGKLFSPPGLKQAAHFGPRTILCCAKSSTVPVLVRLYKVTELNEQRFFVPVLIGPPCCFVLRKIVHRAFFRPPACS